MSDAKKSEGFGLGTLALVGIAGAAAGWYFGSSGAKAGASKVLPKASAAPIDEESEDEHDQEESEESEESESKRGPMPKWLKKNIRGEAVYADDETAAAGDKAPSKTVVADWKAVSEEEVEEAADAGTYFLFRGVSVTGVDGPTMRKVLGEPLIEVAEEEPWGEVNWAVKSRSLDRVLTVGAHDANRDEAELSDWAVFGGTAELCKRLATYIVREAKKKGAHGARVEIK